jgi:hypothetical protein
MDGVLADYFAAWNETDVAERDAEGRLRRILMVHGPLPAGD